MRIASLSQLIVIVWSVLLAVYFVSYPRGKEEDEMNVHLIGYITS